jgi:hypothetical protein
MTLLRLLLPFHGTAVRLCRSGDARLPVDVTVDGKLTLRLSWSGASALLADESAWGLRDARTVTLDFPRDDVRKGVAKEARAREHALGLRPHGPRRGRIKPAAVVSGVGAYADAAREGWAAVAARGRGS